MAPYPVIDIACAEELAKAYEQASGPFTIHRADQPDLLVMSTADYPAREPTCTQAQVARIRDDFEAIDDHDLLDARTCLQDIRARYGI